MQLKVNKSIYENIIKDEKFYSDLTRDEHNILELYFAQDLTIETTAKMMEMSIIEVKDIINGVINSYKESIQYSDFIRTQLTEAEIEKNIAVFEQKASELYDSNTKLDKVMASIFREASKVGKKALLPYKKEASLPMIFEAKVNEFYFSKLVSLIKEIEVLG